mmetsp:Transcript_17022/g.25179  ORF Transcript_17022/g.25179 Transcript_17022/m.25179 type:complete len:462 (-) Transcript_17022:70-1455(-)|eukprot:CAMPEP_0194199526 /NCGR_PEP_ID=MMETSP0156-20130528/513_1 /TAXON_ID=33649 /ORGANISM="Thalassionema nitzschioides, Strain L26-B" /LENGTH=461 /DNA_ID=CAMNT_0038924435 /DNA_START=165 /DNA_END=1550 /DNA_ORIENTATION=-
MITCLATGAAWCFCTACSSLLYSCCGNDKPSSTPPSATSGRKRSVLLLILTTILAFVFQYAVGPYVMDLSISNYVTESWTDGCLNYKEESLQKKCVGNQGVYRATFSAFIFFIFAAAAAYCKPTANREAWPAKYVFFIFLALAMCFIPNDPLFSSIYLNIARVGGIIFVIIQQVIILDIAYNWNESWIEKSNQAESEELQKRWLGAILASCGLLFAVMLTGIGLLFGFYGGCATNIAFISITVVLSIALTALQLTGEEGSLLSSAVIVTYGTYLCFTAVAKNPDASCNPSIGDGDILSIVLGVSMTIVSLAWTGFSYTAEKRVDGTDDNDLQETLVTGETVEEANLEEQKQNDRKVQGIVASTEGNNPNSDEEGGETASNSDAAENKSRPVSWKLNLILAMISCWIAMALTGWGSIEAGGSLSNPDVSRVSMWMIIASQWIMFLLYAWSLSAPRLFHDREF